MSHARPREDHLLRQACREGDHRYVAAKACALTDTRDPQSGKTALHVACECSQEACVHALLAKTATSLDGQDFLGRTPVMLAVLARAPHVVRKLLQHGAATELRDAHGATALMLASAIAEPHCVVILLDYGADIDACATNIGPANALARACAAAREASMAQLDVVSELVSRGARLRPSACDSGALAELLRDGPEQHRARRARERLGTILRLRWLRTHERAGVALGADHGDAVSLLFLTDEARCPDSALAIVCAFAAFARRAPPATPHSTASSTCSPDPGLAKRGTS